MEKLNVEGLAKKVDLDGKNVLVRVDLNVPLAKVCATMLFDAWNRSLMRFWANFCNFLFHSFRTTSLSPMTLGCVPSYPPPSFCSIRVPMLS